jgi:ribosomal protein S18 acetylase RimI-like enzyme
MPGLASSYHVIPAIPSIYGWYDKGMENLEKTKEVREGVVSIRLRKARHDDAELMFRLQHQDGASIDHNDTDMLEKLSDYKNAFQPEKIDVIEEAGEPIGRLRVVRGGDIYVGGLQIMPEHRGRGVGTQIINELINESEGTGNRIKLEVFHSNPRAQKLYEKLGFEVVDENEDQKIMQYTPSSLGS